MHFIPQSKTKVQPPQTPTPTVAGALNRAQRRRLDRQLDREVQGLMGRDGCTVCGAAFEHNARLYGGCDGYGRAVITGDCCSEVLAQVTHAGINTARSYDFLHPRKGKPRRNRSAGATEIISAIATCRGLIADADRQVMAWRDVPVFAAWGRSTYWRAPGKLTIACGSSAPGAIASRASRVPRRS